MHIRKKMITFANKINCGMNKQYQELQVEEGVFIPQPAMDYPQENPFERTLFPKQIKDIVFDEYYP